MSSSAPPTSPGAETAPLAPRFVPAPAGQPELLEPRAAELAAVLAAFSPADPALLQQRALLQRSDTKFLLPTSLLPALLAGLSSHYAVLGAAGTAAAEAPGLRAARGARGALDAPGAPYRTLYFDTAERRCFHDHRRGRRLRHKLRIRTYDDRRLTFLEIKSRGGRSLTDKARLELPYEQDHLDAQCAAMIRARCRLEPAQLLPQLWIEYRRLTLLGLDRQERCTLDFSLSVSDVTRARASAVFEGLAFLELKQPSPDLSSPMMRALRALRLRPRSISKYLVAVCELHPAERANTLRAGLRSVRALRAGATREAA